LDVWKHTLEVVNQYEKITEKYFKFMSFPNASIGNLEVANPGSPIKTFGDDKVSEDKFIRDYLQQEIAGGHNRYALVKFACLLHDIGKPDTKKKEEGGRMSFHSHEHVGANITRYVAKQIKVSVKERHLLEDLVTWHLRPGYLSNFKKPSERMIFRFLRDTKEEALSVLLLALADQASTRGKLTTKAKHEHHYQTCWQMIKRLRETKDDKPVVRLITGNDLIKKLKLEPSALFAKILSEVQEAQALGKVTSKAEALILAARIAKA
jgi:putative nucleotidyltransferase with HDIG domain